MKDRVKTTSSGWITPKKVSNSNRQTKLTKRTQFRLTQSHRLQQSRTRKPPSRQKTLTEMTSQTSDTGKQDKYIRAPGKPGRRIAENPLCISPFEDQENRFLRQDIESRLERPAAQSSRAAKHGWRAMDAPGAIQTSVKGGISHRHEAMQCSFEEQEGGGAEKVSGEGPAGLGEVAGGLVQTEERRAHGFVSESQVTIIEERLPTWNGIGEAEYLLSQESLSVWKEPSTQEWVEVEDRNRQLLNDVDAIEIPTSSQLDKLLHT